jgi:hypothetical protein
MSSPTPLFDIVIPLGPNDISVINNTLQYTKKNIIGYRNIYIISFDDTLQFDGCITISEKLFPFSMETVAKHHGKLERNGWYLQQLFKLYAGLTIPNILENYLVVDSDVFFLKPIHFYADGKFIYTYYYENHLPYYAHMNRLHPSLIKMDVNKSGICHHMLFQTKYIKELFTMVETLHNDVFYNIFLKAVTDYNHSGASEYEIYFNFIQQTHPMDILLRQLKWKNATNLNDMHTNYYDYISYPYYGR